jgi:hypothetical protein
LNKDASNSISKSNHALSTHSLKTSGTIRNDVVFAEGQKHANNNFGCRHEAIITGQAGRGGKLECIFGTIHSVPTN